MPAFEFAMLLVLGIGDGVEEQFEAGDAADIFGWGTAGAVDVAGDTRQRASAIASIVIVCRQSSPKS